jgi:cytochrome c oxidase subunit I
MIGKQFLITGIFWAIIGGFCQSFSDLQLGFPDMQLEFLKTHLGWLDHDPKLETRSRRSILALVTMHGTIMVFFVLTAGLSGTFSNFLIPLFKLVPEIWLLVL